MVHLEIVLPMHLHGALDHRIQKTQMARLTLPALFRPQGLVRVQVWAKIYRRLVRGRHLLLHVSSTVRIQVRPSGSTQLSGLVGSKPAMAEAMDPEP